MTKLRYERLQAKASRSSLGSSGGYSDWRDWSSGMARAYGAGSADSLELLSAGWRWAVVEPEEEDESGVCGTASRKAGASVISAANLGPVVSLRLVDRVREIVRAWRKLVLRSSCARASLAGFAHGARVIGEIRELNPPTERVVEQLCGKVETIEDNTAHVRLIDRDGDQVFAECDARQLAAKGIREGDRFRCEVLERDGETTVRLERVRRPEMTDAEWERLRDETAEALKDYDPADDYQSELADS